MAAADSSVSMKYLPQEKQARSILEGKKEEQFPLKGHLPRICWLGASPMHSKDWNSSRLPDLRYQPTYDSTDLSSRSFLFFDAQTKRRTRRRHVQCRKANLRWWRKGKSTRILHWRHVKCSLALSEAMQSPMLDVSFILHSCLGRLNTMCDHLCSLKIHCLYYRKLAFGSPVAFRRNSIIGFCFSRAMPWKVSSTKDQID